MTSFWLKQGPVHIDFLTRKNCGSIEAAATVFAIPRVLGDP